MLATLPVLALTDHLKQLRAAAGLSYQVLAERSYVDVKYLHDLETGKKARPSRDVLIRVGVGLGLELEDIDELLTVAGHPAILPVRVHGNGNNSNDTHGVK